MGSLTIYYILAQAIERIIELVSDFNIWGNSKTTRTITLWLIVSVLGVAVAGILNIGLLAVTLKCVGSIGGPATGTNPAGCPVNSVLDWIVTGIALGSGTKPIHDILSLLEKNSDRAANERPRRTARALAAAARQASVANA